MRWINFVIVVIINFINERYKISVTKKDFKTIREMINYILDKENENQNYSK